MKSDTIAVEQQHEPFATFAKFYYFPDTEILDASFHLVAECKREKRPHSQAGCCSKLESLRIHWGQTFHLPTVVIWGWVTCPGGCSAARGHLVTAMISTQSIPVEM